MNRYLMTGIKVFTCSFIIGLKVIGEGQRQCVFYQLVSIYQSNTFKRAIFVHKNIYINIYNQDLENGFNDFHEI